MERIVLEVDDEAGKAYQKLSGQIKKQFNNVINIMLKKVANDSTAGDYKKMLDAAGNEAAANGLTPEMLDELLGADD